MIREITTRIKFNTLVEELEVAEKVWGQMNAAMGGIHADDVEFDLEIKRAIVADYEARLAAEEGRLQ